MHRNRQNYEKGKKKRGSPGEILEQNRDENKRVLAGSVVL